MASANRLIGLLGTAGWLWTTEVEAETFTAVTEGPPSCVDQRAFALDIVARAPSASISEPGTYAFAVRLYDRGSKFYGVMTVRRRGRVIANRQLDASSCAEVTSAFALIAALTLDPKARTEPTENLDHQAAGANALEPQASAPRESRLASAPAAETSPNIEHGVELERQSGPNPERPTPVAVAASNQPQKNRLVPPRPERVAATAAVQSNTPRRGVSLGAVAAWLSPIVPSGVFWAGAMVGTRMSRGPALRLTFAVAPTTERSNTHGESARYSYIGGAVDIGWDLLSTDEIFLDAGLRGAVGALKAEGLQEGRIMRSARSRFVIASLGPALSVTRRWSNFEVGVFGAIPVALKRAELEIYVPEREVFSTTAAVGVEVGVAVAAALGQ